MVPWSCQQTNERKKMKMLSKIMTIAAVAYGVLLVVKGTTIPGCVIVALALM